MLHAVGCAEAGRYFSRHPEAADKTTGDYRQFHDVEFHGDEVVLACEHVLLVKKKCVSG